MKDEQDDKIKRRAEFADMKAKRRAAENISLEEQNRRAKEVISSSAFQESLKRLIEQNKNEHE